MNTRASYAATMMLVAVTATASDARVAFHADAYGALGNAVVDDRAALQRALDAADAVGGGTVLLGCDRTYRLDGPLFVPSHVTVRGCGRRTVLVRSPTTWQGPVPVWTADGRCVEESRKDRYVLMNKHGNCGDAGIRLRDFAIDGQVQRVTPSAAAPNAVAVLLLATSDVIVSHLQLREVAQDGIFVKSPRGRITLRDNDISGTNLAWGNGGGIIVEEWAEVADLAPGNVRIERNHITVREPRFCDGPGPLPASVACTVDSDCVTAGTGTCARHNAAVAGVVLVRSDIATPPVRTRLLRNRFDIANDQPGILCNGCGPVTVWKNKFRAASWGACDPNSSRPGRRCRRDGECGARGGCRFEPDFTAIRANGPSGGRCGGWHPGLCGRGPTYACLRDTDCAVPLGRLALIGNTIRLSGSEQRHAMIRLISRDGGGSVRERRNRIVTSSPIPSVGWIEVTGVRVDREADHPGIEVKVRQTSVLRDERAQGRLACADHRS